MKKYHRICMIGVPFQSNLRLFTGCKKLCRSTVKSGSNLTFVRKWSCYKASQSVIRCSWLDLAPSWYYPQPILSRMAVNASFTGPGLTVTFRKNWNHNVHEGNLPYSKVFTDRYRLCIISCYNGSINERANNAVCRIFDNHSVKMYRYISILWIKDAIPSLSYSIKKALIHCHSYLSLSNS